MSRVLVVVYRLRDLHTQNEGSSAHDTSKSYAPLYPDNTAEYEDTADDDHVTRYGAGNCNMQI